MKRTLVGLMLLWLVGFNFRSVIFSVPPVLPQVRSELDLSFTFTGSITSITVFFLGAAALLFVPALGWGGALLLWTSVALAGALLWYVIALLVPARAEEPRGVRSL